MRDPNLHGTNHTVMYLVLTIIYTPIIHVPRFLFPAMNQHNED